MHTEQNQVADADIQLIRACSRDEQAAEQLLALWSKRAPAAAASAEFDVAAFLEVCSDIFVAYDRELRYIAINRQGARFLGRTPAEVIGKSNRELIGEGAQAIEPYLQRCFETAEKVFVLHEIPTSQGVLLCDTIYTPVPGQDGRIEQVVGICRDVTANRERTNQLEQLVQMQAATLQELSTPLLHIRPGVVLMPLIGAIDSRRAQQMTETLLHGAAELRAAVVIIDISGVTAVDQRVAGALVSVAKAARLLGSRVILTGLTARVAQTLVEQNADLTGITTFSSLQQGIAAAL